MLSPSGCGVPGSASHESKPGAVRFRSSEKSSVKTPTAGTRRSSNVSNEGRNRLRPAGGRWGRWPVVGGANDRLCDMKCLDFSNRLYETGEADPDARTARMSA